jgi:hypothetical protein
MLLQVSALAFTGAVAVFLLLMSVPLPAFLLRYVLKLVHNHNVTYFLRMFLIVMLVVFVCMSASSCTIQPNHLSLSLSLSLSLCVCLRLVTDPCVV